MPFVALNKTTKERIDITKIDNPRETLKSGDVICQLCESPMIVKAGMIYRPHFAHFSDCNTDYNYHPQSPEHLLGKELVANALKSHFSDYVNAEIEFEVRVPEVRRVADVMATFPNGWRQAHEVQLASITIGDLEKRTGDYYRAGIDVIWYLGNNANSQTNRTWCLDQFGYCFTLEISKVTDASQVISRI